MNALYSYNDLEKISFSGYFNLCLNVWFVYFCVLMQKYTWERQIRYAEQIRDRIETAENN